MESEETYKGLDPDLNDDFITTQLYAGMEKLDAYLAKQAAFLDYMENTR